MADKIKVIVKRPDELYGHMTNISNTLENMQKIVEGPIETLTMPGYVLILNEEGRIREELRNIYTHAILGASEMIQVAAMAMKMSKTL